MILRCDRILADAAVDQSWLIFISNLTLFTMEGDIKERFLSVELGGLVGLVLTVVTLLAVSALSKVIGGLFGFLIPLAVLLFLLIIVHPYAP